jgi:hypothetical protein
MASHGSESEAIESSWPQIAHSTKSDANALKPKMRRRALRFDGQK